MTFVVLFLKAFPLSTDLDENHRPLLTSSLAAPLRPCQRGDGSQFVAYQLFYSGKAGYERWKNIAEGAGKNTTNLWPGIVNVYGLTEIGTQRFRWSLIQRGFLLFFANTLGECNDFTLDRYLFAVGNAKWSAKRRFFLTGPKIRRSDPINVSRKVNWLTCCTLRPWRARPLLR